MKLRILVQIGGGRNLNPGDVAEFEDGEARRMMAARFAVPFVETTAIEPITETRQVKSARKRKQ